MINMGVIGIHLALEIDADDDRHAGGEPPVETRQKDAAQIPGNHPGIPLRPAVGVDDDVGAEPDEQRRGDALPDAPEMAVGFRPGFRGTTQYRVSRNARWLRSLPGPN